MDHSRRQMLKASSFFALGLSTELYARGFEVLDKKPTSSGLIHAPEGISATELASNEKFWKKVAAQFQPDRSFINLENGYYGIMPSPIFDNYLQNTQRLNRLNSYLLRFTSKTEVEAARNSLAQALGISNSEIAFTRGGTEALQNLISGYNKLEPGDQVMYADLDYYSCQYAFKWLETRRKVSLVKISIPEPAGKQAVLDTYAQAFESYPRLKLILLTHLNNRTGLVLPVNEITQMAKNKGIDVILDVAHSWGQLDFNLKDLKADFIGMSLHKWIHAPLGMGCLYIRESRLQDIDPCHGDELYEASDIRSRVHSGTMNIAPCLTLPTALDFHLALGARVKQERLRYLRNCWVSQVSALDEVQVLTPNQDEMHGGITSFRIRGKTTQAENDKLADYLFNEHKIFTVRRSGLTLGDCVRVTPALFTMATDVEKLASAIQDVVKNQSKIF